MKTNLLRTLAGCAVMVAALQCSTAGAAPAAPAAHPKLCKASGEVSAVNPAGHSVTLARFLSHRTFNLANDCAITVGNDHSAALADLKPGMEVRVHYQNADGVYVATKIAEVEKTMAGQIKSLDLKADTLTLKAGPFRHHFMLAKDCEFVGLRGAKETASALEVGERATIHFAKVNGKLVAERIVMPHATFVGTLEAIHPRADTVMAEKHQFDLAKNCAIVIHGKANGRLSDLTVGERVAINYRNVDGVWVATRIAPAGATMETAQNSALHIVPVP